VDHTFSIVSAKKSIYYADAHKWSKLVCSLNLFTIWLRHTTFKSARWANYHSSG